LAGIGASEVAVSSQPKVTIIVTGKELRAKSTSSRVGFLLVEFTTIQAALCSFTLLMLIFFAG